MEPVRKRNSPLTVARISVPRPHDVLADYLRDRILKGEMAEGEALPSERELVEQTGLTRGAVRQALKTLAVEGLVQTRHGRFGGSIVKLPGHATLATAINRFVQGRKLPVRALQETREVLEPFLARLAAERRTEENLAELKALHEDLINARDNFRDFSSANVNWHNAVARASGNELLATFLYSISHGVFVATHAEEYDTSETREQVILVHSRVNDAIRSRDAEAAEKHMRHHMRATHARPLAIGASAIPLTEDAALSLGAQPRTAVRRLKK